MLQAHELELEGDKQKHHFIIHFHAPDDFNLDALLALLGEEWTTTATEKRGTNFRTIEIETPLSSLRHVLEAIPKRVLVSYEQKQPEKK